jgi:hypothetical protein
LNNLLKIALARAIIKRAELAKSKPPEPTIYAAGKIWYAPIFRKMRENFKINSRWIYLDQDHEIVKTRKDVLWEQCLQDYTSADIMIIWSGNYADEQRGVLVELGQALAAGKYVYLINSGASFEANGGSDAAYTYHPRFVKLEADGPYSGFRQAVKHWQERAA